MNTHTHTHTHMCIYKEMNKSDKRKFFVKKRFFKYLKKKS